MARYYFASFMSSKGFNITSAEKFSTIADHEIVGVLNSEAFTDAERLLLANIVRNTRWKFWKFIVV